MTPNDAEIERAEERVAEECAQAIAKVGARLGLPGSTHCQTCGDEISPARRAAYPAARNCIDCARAKEVHQWTK